MKFAFVIAALFAVSAIAAPCGRKHVGGDDVVDTTGPDAGSNSDHLDEIKKVSEKTEVHNSNEQTAVINEKSPQGAGGHGSLLNVQANDLLSDGVLNHKTNKITQNNN